MKDITDKLMNIWLSLPESIYPNTREIIKDGKGQFDVNQPQLRGVALAENGSEVPFFCIRVAVQRMNPQTGLLSHGLAVMSFFRDESGWHGTLATGSQPSFDLKTSLPPLQPETITMILSGEVMEMPYSMFQMM